MVDQVTLHTLDPRTGQQFAHSDIGGHFMGHSDGVIQGLLQAPSTTHVWEHKQVDDKKQVKLESLKLEHGEKGALAQWDPIYYAQAMLYCHYHGFTRHYLTCASPGGRRTVSVRTNADPNEAGKQRKKAEMVITAPEPLERLSDRPDWYECKWCNHHDICHGARVAEVSCRTCVHATPTLDGDGRWICERYNVDLSEHNQRTACHSHLLIPVLVPYAEAVDADDSGSWIEYTKLDGTVFRNGLDYYTSWELSAVDQAMIGDPLVKTVKKNGARIIAGEPERHEYTRPSVSCGTCRYFQRDTIGDGSGSGSCPVGGDGVMYQTAILNRVHDRPYLDWRTLGLWPNAERLCGDFECN